MNNELREELELLSGWDIPKCDVLEFLLEKLPSTITDSDGYTYRLRGGKNQYYFFEYQYEKDADMRWWSISPFSKESPSDALCQLAIKLFKEGILSRE